MPKATKKTAKDVVNAAWVLEDANIVHALTYFPFFIGPIAMYILGKTDKKKAMHHIKYALLMATAVCLLFFVLNGFVSQILSITYIVASGYLAFKAYKGEDVQIEILDTVEDKISKTIKK